jgi:hypothetical protein
MSNEVVTLHVTKTSTYYMSVQLDESISLEDLDQIDFDNLVMNNTSDGEDTCETSWEEETNCEPEYILVLDESGKPDFSDVN